MTRESSTKQTTTGKIPYPASFRSHIHLMEDTMRSLVLIAFSVVLLPNVLVARSARDSNRQTAVNAWSNLKKQLHSGQRIEVVDYDLHSRKGKFISVSSRGILLETSGGEQVMMPRTKVFRVVTHKQIERVKNGLIGLGAGAVIGGYLGGVGSRTDASRDAIIGASIGAAIGVIGAAWDAPEVTIYRAPDSQHAITTVASPVARQTSATASAGRSPYESSPNPRLMETILGEEQTPAPSHITYQVVPQRQDGPAVQQPIQPISIEPVAAQLGGAEFAPQERSQP
ncbi:MAG: hypothetical protein HYX73_00745 [Acidobacteria bacterium]|nr:hypothetical protein [Acidobacteriota bacterium]